jgi:hypothetical protein
LPSFFQFSHMLNPSFAGASKLGSLNEELLSRSTFNKIYQRPSANGVPLHHDSKHVPAKGERTAFRNRTCRAKTYIFLEARSSHGRIFETFTMSLILMNTLCFIFSTVPKVNRQGGIFFFVIEVITVAVFTLEYVLRLWCIVEDKHYAQRQPCGSTYFFCEITVCS